MSNGAVERNHVEPRYEEPRNVGPIAGGNLRASDADRDKVTTVLTTAYAEGRITRDEHDERLEQVMAAKTFDELIPITSDLVLTPAPQALRQAQGTVRQAQGTVPEAQGTVPEGQGTGFAIDSTNANPEIDTMVGIFGGTTRKGKWRIRKETRAYALFGGIDLDLREATFEAPVVEISGAWVFGGLDIKVPAGIEVRDQTVGVFGGTDVGNLGEPKPGAPVLVLKGLSLFGGVSVKGPKPDKKKRARHSGH